MNDGGGGGEVQTRAARLERQNEDFRVRVVLEGIYHFHALGRGHTAVEKFGLAARGIFNPSNQAFAHFAELRKDERLAPRLAAAAKELEERFSFAGVGFIDKFFLELRGRIGDLLKVKNHAQNLSAA